MSKRGFIYSAALWLTLCGTPLLACYWDYDTLKMERRQFPGVLELITGKFLRHSSDYYQWRIEDRIRRLKSQPDHLPYYDDLAVAYDKIGRHDDAIATMLRKGKLKSGLYETEANLGTFLIHAGRFEEGLEHIKRAIDINPNAHFGREIYQQLLVEYVISRRDGRDMIPLPLDPEPRDDFRDPEGFALFVVERRLGEASGYSEERDAELKRATKGVLGMMRFGNYDSPILLEALGDLLLAAGYPDDPKRLAARAYLKASYGVDSDEAQAAYAHLAESALERQTRDTLTHTELTLPQLEAVFKQELAEAKSWHSELAANERRWIREGRNVDAEFTRTYYDEPAIEYRDPAAVRAEVNSWLLFAGLAVAALSFLAALLGTGFACYVLLRRRWRRAAIPEGTLPAD